MTSKLNRKAMVLGILSWLATVSAVAVAHGEDAKPEAGEPGRALSRAIPAAVPLHAEERLDERSERDVVLPGRVPFVLPM